MIKEASQLTPEHLQVLRSHVEAETHHRMSETLATLSEDCVFEDHALERTWQGHAAAQAYYLMWWTAFGVVPHTSQRYFPSEDRAIVETRFKGRHVGTFLGFEATQRSVDIPIAIVVSFSEGLISGERLYWNLNTLLHQIGASSVTASGLVQPAYLTR